MLKGPMVLASVGLGLNLVVWGIPGMLAASGAQHLLPSTSGLVETLGSLERYAGPTPSLPEAFVQLIGAESEALHVAGSALQQPTPADLSPRATAAGTRVQAAVGTYIRSAQVLINHTPHP
jgi:hypothetical protein